MSNTITGNGNHFVIANSLDGPRVVAANVTLAQARGIAETSRVNTEYPGCTIAIYEIDRHIDNDLLRTVVKRGDSWICSGERDPRTATLEQERLEGSKAYSIRSIPEELE